MFYRNRSVVGYLRVNNDGFAVLIIFNRFFYDFVDIFYFSNGITYCTLGFSDFSVIYVNKVYTIPNRRENLSPVMGSGLTKLNKTIFSHQITGDYEYVCDSTRGSYRLHMV